VVPGHEDGNEDLHSRLVIEGSEKVPEQSILLASEIAELLNHVPFLQNKVTYGSLASHEDSCYFLLFLFVLVSTFLQVGVNSGFSLGLGLGLLRVLIFDGKGQNDREHETIEEYVKWQAESVLEEAGINSCTLHEDTHFMVFKEALGDFLISVLPDVLSD